MPDLDANLRRASAGDKEALQELVVAHLDDLERFIRRRTSARLLDKESLSDLVQSAAREALAHLSQHDYQGPTAFRAWLYKVALTKIIAHHRRIHTDKRDVRREEPGDPDVHLGEVCAHFSSPSGAAMAQELQARFTAAFARLSPEHQQVFFLGRVLDLPHAEISVQMGRSEAACRKLLVRALSSLGVHMGMDEGHAVD
jgi:RNA polymerase sigma factor (sigma-70 family)